MRLCGDSEQILSQKDQSEQLKAERMARHHSLAAEDGDGEGHDGGGGAGDEDGVPDDGVEIALGR